MSEKIENLLNVSLSVGEEERVKSGILNIGYDSEEQTWELIVKHNGDLSRFSTEGLKIEELIAGYAIVTIKESLIEAFSNLEEVEYIEMPKRLFFADERAKQDACILQVTRREPYLTGKGVLIGVIDSGIDYLSPHFRTPSGNTRIVKLWDQTLTSDEAKGWNSPEGFGIGVEFDATQLNTALQSQTRARALELVGNTDYSGHGTAVAGIAGANAVATTSAQNPAAPSPTQTSLAPAPTAAYAGVAPESDLVIVKLGNPNPRSFPRTTELMRALKYVVDVATLRNQPIAINLSFGNTYGSHEGSSLLERYIDNIAEIGKNVICVGSGNEGSGGGHVSGRVTAGEVTRVELAIDRYETGLNLQLWKNFADEYRITIVSPGGERYLLPLEYITTNRVNLEGTDLLIYFGLPTPYSVNQEIFIDFLPSGVYLTSGVWTFEIDPVRVVTGEYDFYLPSQSIRGTGTWFYSPTPDVTLTIPSTAAKVITVGAYDVITQSYADFSGRGYVADYGQTGVLYRAKPDLVAPGVDIEVLRPEGGSYLASGTSYATPFVTGAAALLMEWGIVRGNDPYLYGEKLKAYLIKGARRLRGIGGESATPNPLTGWGALCVENSLAMR